MENGDDLFRSESVNEQIEHLAGIQDQRQQSVIPGAPTIAALQSIYQEDEALLERAWQRIQREQSASHARSARNGHDEAPVPAHDKIERKSPMQKIQPISTKKKRPGWLASSLIAAVLLVVIIASTALIYTRQNAQTTTGSGGNQITAIIATPGQQASATPARQPSPTLAAQESPTPSAGNQSQSWPVGQSTYWANLRYHQLTGYWVTWTGNADEWVAGARSAGWHVSTQPHMPSIIVLMPYVQSASTYGHVAVVESLVPGSNPQQVHTSDMNWPVNGGGFNKVSYANFTVGEGVYFIWHP